MQRSYFQTIVARINEPRKSGLHVFCELFRPHRSVLVGEGGIPIEIFLHSDLKELFV